ncbi:hypothetical protein GW17_00031375 [Ensete ventricosum]|nr:hypothetical protein GW17_00031375 [Ensete ventricosum]
MNASQRGFDCRGGQFITFSPRSGLRQLGRLLDLGKPDALLNRRKASKGDEHKCLVETHTNQLLFAIKPYRFEPWRKISR